MTQGTPILRIALPLPLRRLFDYLSPPEPGPYLPGARIRVQFGKRELIGFIVEVSSHSEIALERLKPALSLLDQKPLFSPHLLTLIQWMSTYYHAPLGEVFDLATPSWLRKGHPAEDFTHTYWQLTNMGETIKVDSLSHTLQKGVMSYLQNCPEKTASDILLKKEGFSSAVLRSLHKKEWIQKIKRPWSENFLIPQVSSSPLSLNEQQKETVTAVEKAFGTFHTFLLQGVTGSGKTEVYMTLMQKMIDKSQQVLMLIPEIGLTPQTLMRLQNRFSVPIVVIHSGLSEKERFQAWYMASTGQASIVVGTRSAVFTPFKKLGLCIIDEEHDTSFKQQEGCRYSARDVLIKRCQLENIPIVLGSATPSLESFYNTQIGRYQMTQLSKRAGFAELPSLQLLDIRHQQLEEGLSSSLLSHIQQHLEQQGQVLLFLNRRGYAPVLYCSQCEWHASCKQCDAKLTFHFQSQQLRCHHCESSHSIPPHCPHCSATQLIPVGQGTERLEAALKRHFPDKQILRLDRDTTSKKSESNPFESALHKKFDILLGTQMIAKGHHFPNVTLVAILDIDSALFSNDFRSIERMGQLITQVAGRAGRSHRLGQVILQTAHPHHPLFEQLFKEGYEAFAFRLLAERKLAELPPYSYQALIRAEGRHKKQALQFLTFIKNEALSVSHSTIEILGPIPALMEKRLGYYRAQLLLQSTQRTYLQRFIQQLLLRIEDKKIQHSLRWSLDIDPVEMF